MTQQATYKFVLLVAFGIWAVGACAASDVGAADGRLLGEAGDSKDRVYWACRLNACRVNIAFTNRDTRQTAVAGTRIAVGPPTQVWLLRSDGSHIPGLREVPTSIGATNFEFPLSAQEEAFAVVVRIGDKLHTWWLAPDPAKTR